MLLSGIDNPIKEDVVSLHSLLMEPWFKAACYSAPTIVWGVCMAFCSLTFKSGADHGDGWKAPQPIYERLAANPITWHMAAWTVIAFVLEVLL